jgi:hypothetical protein
MTDTDPTRPPVTHTPGSWEHDGQFIIAPDPNGIHSDIYIAEIVEADEEGRLAPTEQQVANARLIAAAPELLEACRMVVDNWERGDLAAAARACDAAVEMATAA